MKRLNLNQSISVINLQDYDRISVFSNNTTPHCTQNELKRKIPKLSFTSSLECIDDCLSLLLIPTRSHTIGYLLILLLLCDSLYLRYKNCLFFLLPMFQKTFGAKLFLDDYLKYLSIF